MCVEWGEGRRDGDGGTSEGCWDTIEFGVKEREPQILSSIERLFVWALFWGVLFSDSLWWGLGR